MGALASTSDDVLQQLRTFEAAFVALKARLEPFLATPQRDLDAQVQPPQRAAVHLALAKAVHSVFLCYLRAAGAAEDSHASKAAERVRLYDKKVRKLESERWLAHNSAQTQINVAAANRFISAAIPDLTPTQRAALKAAREQARRQGGAGPPGAKGVPSAAEEADAFLAGELGAGGMAGAQAAGESDSAAPARHTAGAGLVAAADRKKAAKQRRRQA